MRVLFCSHRDRQHLYAMVPLAWACRAAGHEVRIAGAPALTDAIVHTGLPAVPVGRDEPPPSGASDVKKIFQHRPFPPDWPAQPHLLDEEQRAAVELLAHNCARAAEYAVDDLIAFASDWRPDVVVHDIAGFAGAVAAAAVKVPNVRHINGPGLQPMETRVGSTEPHPDYADLFERRGLGVRVRPTLTVRPLPPSLHQPIAGPCHDFRYVPYNGVARVPAWLATLPERPRVLLTWGLSVERAVNRLGPQAIAPFRLAVEALSRLDAEVLLMATEEQLHLLGETPGNVRPVTGVALHLALPHCSAIVHQAGEGSTMAAAGYGVPQLTITRTPDTALVGDRLTAIGGGLHLRYQDVEADPDAGMAVADAVATLLADPAHTEAARRLRDEIARQPPPITLVGALRELAGG